MTLPSLDPTARHQRRLAISQHPTQKGLDAVEAVTADPLRLLLHFIPVQGSSGAESLATAVPGDLAPRNVQILDARLSQRAELLVQAIVPGKFLISFALTEAEPLLVDLGNQNDGSLPESWQTIDLFNADDADFTVSQAEETWVIASADGSQRYRVRSTADGGLEIFSETEPVLTVTVTPSPGQAAPLYTLTLVDVPNIDPFFNQADFSIEHKRISEFDPVTVPVRVTPPISDLPIDYLTRDYASFRQLMLDRLSVLMPQWKERSPADLGITLVEVMAYAADRLSYYQDAVATEAYLGTARRRPSLRRHARLIDYPMHEGCNARAWVQIQVTAVGGAAVEPVSFPAGTLLLTPLAGQPVGIIADNFDDPLELPQPPELFETLHPLNAYADHNEFPFYSWGAQAFVIPAGSTQATLQDRSNRPADQPPTLKAGDLLVFEVRPPATGTAATPEEPRCHTVRLTRVTPAADPLGGQLAAPPRSGEVSLLEIEWHSQDALPFDLPVARRGSPLGQYLTVALGNIVLAEHGYRIRHEVLPPVPNQAPYRPCLEHPDLTHAVPFNEAQAQTQPASVLLQQDPQQAVPMINLQSVMRGETWWGRRELLSSGPLDAHFVVEMEQDRHAVLRFGQTGRGKTPTPQTRLVANYRIGNGSRGNVGRDAIAHLVAPPPQASRVKAVRNPLPAQGGIDPESLDQVRLYAPQMLHSEQARCVTAEDYRAVAERHPGVAVAAAMLRWTGSWYTAFVAVKPQQNRPFDETFRHTLLDFLEPYRLAGHDLEIVPPHYEPLDLAFTLYLQPGFFTSTVRQTLLETFSNQVLPNGEKGFFYPDNFTFGQPLYLSKVVQQMMQVPGVARVALTEDVADPSVITRFHPWGRPGRVALDRGELAISALSILQVDNDPTAPARGRIEFHLRGGL